jgi:hypothetical protein
MGYHFHQGRWVLRRQSRESVVLKFPCRYLLKHSAVPENPALAKERSFFLRIALLKDLARKSRDAMKSCFQCNPGSVQFNSMVAIFYIFTAISNCSDWDLCMLIFVETKNGPYLKIVALDLAPSVVFDDLALIIDAVSPFGNKCWL